MLKNKIGIKQEDFVKEVDGKQVSLFVLENSNGAELTVTNFGAKIVSLLVPDKNNQLTDVVTGYNNIDDYLKSGEIYFGAAIGRYGNRIANGKFELDGVVYNLAQNNEPNSLHGGPKGFHAVVWDAKMIDKQTLELSYLSKDMEEGFPGNLEVKMFYSLTDSNEFVIDYYAQSDKKTICNLTNHTYFNLTGDGSNTILDHKLKINAKEYLPTNEVAIPLGKPASVTGTPMDFSTAKEIGCDIEKDFIDLKLGNGYDHNFIVNDDKIGLVEAAVVFSPVSGIEMTVHTDQPGLQLYSGNYMNGTEIGKTGNAYVKRSAFCLEAQHYPDSPNQSQFPSVVLSFGETYRQTTKHTFSVRK